MMDANETKFGFIFESEACCRYQQRIESKVETKKISNSASMHCFEGFFFYDTPIRTDGSRRARKKKNGRHEDIFEILSVASLFSLRDFRTAGYGMIYVYRRST